MADTFGTWRRIHVQGVIEGRRINSVPLQSEAWYWRLTLMADDFGNLPADSAFLRGRAAPMRNLSPRQIHKLTADLIGANLVTAYEACGERYLHLIDFADRQKPANGKPVARYPLPPHLAETRETKPNQRSHFPKTQTQTRPETDQSQTGVGVVACDGDGGVEGGLSDADRQRNFGILVALGLRRETAAKMAPWYTTRRLVEVEKYVRKKGADNPAGLAIKVLAKTEEPDITVYGRLAMRQGSARRKRS